MSLRIVPVSWDTASRFVVMWHRHHDPPVGGKFWAGIADEADILRGIHITGRPTARLFDNGLTLEVTRVATDGTKNAGSMLYAAAWQAARALGYRRLVTYTQEDESGASLRGAGWRIVAERPARKGWDTPSRPREDKYGGIERTLWEP
jgi:hypothetical protein